MNEEDLRIRKVNYEKRIVAFKWLIGTLGFIAVVVLFVAVLFVIFVPRVSV